MTKSMRDLSLLLTQIIKSNFLITSDHYIALWKSFPCVSYLLTQQFFTMIYMATDRPTRISSQVIMIYFFTVRSLMIIWATINEVQYQT